MFERFGECTFWTWKWKVEKCFILRLGSNVVSHMRRIECKLAKSIVFSHLHSIRRMWNTTCDPCLNYTHALDRPAKCEEHELALQLKKEEGCNYKKTRLVLCQYTWLQYVHRGENHPNQNCSRKFRHDLPHPACTFVCDTSNFKLR